MNLEKIIKELENKIKELEKRLSILEHPPKQPCKNCRSCHNGEMCERFNFI